MRKFMTAALMVMATTATAFADIAPEPREQTSHGGIILASVIACAIVAVAIVFKMRKNKSETTFNATSEEKSEGK